MSRPSVSVCIVTFNQRGLIGQCVWSVLEQNADADVEVMVGDDASTDGTSDVIAQLVTENAGRIRHFPRRPRLGPFANMRDLIARADGDFVARVDGDDFWLPGKLQRQLTYLQDHPDCSAVYTNAITVDEAGNRIGLFNDVGDARFDLVAMLRRGNFLNNSSILFRRAGREAYLGVKAPQVDYRAHLWHARHGWLAHIAEPLVAYRVNASGSMVAGMNDRVRELYWEAIQSVPRELVTNGDYAAGLADFLRRVAFRAARTRNGSMLRTWAGRVLAESPYGRARTVALAAGAIARMACRIGYGKFAGGPYGRGVKVLYRR